MSLFKCKDCNKKISTDAQICPKCGADNSDKIKKLIESQVRAEEFNKQLIQKFNYTFRRLPFFWIVLAVIVIGILYTTLSFRFKNDPPRWRAASSHISTESLKRKPPVDDAHLANASDIKQAEQFLLQIPPACNRSSARALSDGTVRIRVICEGDQNSMDGTIEIKDGIVKEIR